MIANDWTDLSENLIKRIGHNNYKSWIAPLKFDAIRNGVAYFHAPTPFLGTWVSRNFKEHIRAQLQEAGFVVQRIEIKSLPASQSAAKTAPADNKKHKSDGPTGASKMASGGQPAYSVSRPVDSRFTFENFVVGKPNELAHAAARRVAEGGAVTFNPLFLYGGVGLGKTHLMHAITQELAQNCPELNVVYLSAEQFMYRFVQALRDKKIMNFKEMFRSIDVLMVDDVQFIAGKESTQEEFFHTFNALVDQNKQIILSADRSPGEIKDLEERIKSRLQCGLVVDLHPTDYELRLGILQAKAASYRQQHGDINIDKGVLEFLAHRITSNVRILEGALMRLYAFSSLVGRDITLELTQECLSDVLRSSEKYITVEDIQRKVAEYYNIRLSEMIGPTRLRKIARPRQVAIYLSKKMTARSLPEIGRRFGGRDHTTILYGARKIEELLSQDTQLADDVQMLQRLLQS